MSDDLTAAHIVVKGRVQGVGYRYFAQEKAQTYDLKGWVRNLPGRDVEAHVEGSRSVIECFLEDLHKGPPLARIDSVDVQWSPPADQFTTFEIR
jgi:acylphosphatase